MTTFEKLGLSDETLKALKDLNFETPTDIQKSAIPKLIDGNKDFIGLAQTGTGKTAAFGLPLVELVSSDYKYTQALILAPTRELGKQIAEQLALYSKYKEKLNVLAVYGGASIGEQIRALKKIQHIIIATPGRLIDLIKRKSIFLDKVNVVILDEADEMLNMGFKEDLDEILSFTPEEKLTWLFSATMPDFIRKIVKKYMHDPVEVKVNTKNEVNANISHQFVKIRQRDKSEALTRFIDIDPEMRGIVFCRTKRDTQDLAELLLKKNYKVDAIHGDLSQAQRDRVMKRFKSHALKILIATDVAARGIDVNDLSHVFHYTLPDDDSYYTHRSGRTARAGKKGLSISFVNSKDSYRIKRFEKSLKIEISKIEVPNPQDIIENRLQNWCQSILEEKPKSKISEEMISKANLLFSNLTKEELVSKLLSKEFGELQLDSHRDLNDNSPDSSRSSGGRRDRNRDRGRSRSRSRDRDKSRSRDRDRDRDRSKSRRSEGSSGGTFQGRRRKSNDETSNNSGKRKKYSRRK